jgi:hypothetical protein
MECVSAITIGVSLVGEILLQWITIAVHTSLSVVFCCHCIGWMRYWMGGGVEETTEEESPRLGGPEGYV